MKQWTDMLLRVPPFRFIADMVDVYFSKRVGRAAAELAYFLILTFFPIIICVSAFLNVLNVQMSTLLNQAEGILPAVVISIFREYLRYIDTNQSTALLIVGILMAMLFASAAVRSLMNIMQEIYGRTTFRGVGQLIASILFSFLLLVTIYLSMAVVVSGNWFFHTLGTLLGLENLLDRFALWQGMKYVLLLALVFLFILLLYRVSAPLDKPRPPVLLGALLASVALAIASGIFSFLVGSSAQYSLVYGSLASVIIMLVWLYLCGNVLILGAAFNYVLYTHLKERRNKR